MAGPLGVVLGMTFDVGRNRYFPTPPDLHLNKFDDGILMPTSCGGGRGKEKGIKLASHDETDGQPSRRRLRRGRTVLGNSARTKRRSEETKAHFSSLGYQATYWCYGGRITSLRNYTGGAYLATTAHGDVFVYHGQGEPRGISLCASELVGMHVDIARMIMIAIANGPEAHLHCFRRDPDLLDHLFLQQSDLDLPQSDVFCMSSGDGVCSLGGIKSLTSLYYIDRLHTSKRDLPSDALALHHSSPDLVFAGLRSSSVLLEDLRAQSRIPNVVASTAEGRAVIGVKRLKDSAVPWGLVVSAMDDQLLLFDVRFGKSPLIRFKDHRNNFQSSLGLTTSSDDEIVVAAGSDCRIRAWSTVTGDRIVTGDEDQRADDPLSVVFPHIVQAIEGREDFGLDVAVDAEIRRYAFR
ncbi:MAG: hypothetical protein TREMPRED_004974 [Tremellales sp. Tagirdzhanova-0007]|nr:MAG: hypothetical protein TREMPRED_004974 [Tremellales sp. Tagirdzhanova-0007]